jgi:hypothetical protein
VKLTGNGKLAIMVAVEGNVKHQHDDKPFPSKFLRSHVG